MSFTIINRIIIAGLIFGFFLGSCTNDSESESSTDPETSEEVVEEESVEDFQNLVWNLKEPGLPDSTVPFFGQSMDMNNDGSKIVLGTADSPPACSTFCDGLVRVYDVSNGIWTQINNDLYGDNETSSDFIGHDVAISNDGNFIAVSYKPFSGSLSYSTRVFQNRNGEWIQVGEDIINYGNGIDASINAAGNILAVAMPYNVSDNLGKIYKLKNDNWEQIGEDIELGKNAKKVALNYNGDVLAIASIFESGMVSFYDVFENGWQLVSQIRGKTENDRLSSGMDLSGEGDTIILQGSFPNNTCNLCTSREAFVQVYTRDGNGWKEKGQEITWSEEGYFINQQKAVAINYDGNRIAIGLQRIKENSPNQFEAFVLTYQYSENDDEWIQMPSIDQNGGLGRVNSLDMNDDGDIIAVGGNMFKLELLD